ncbi:hypothetical protein BT96DRAFT_1018774 [Gymnopus androsaceus JB14]|uniref:F-box domain-containing protein n=1 Tax=Gymnopus androsaceus JB14 TaxID=1447944 RepID=A0A6A4HUF2_9AGAR|nr:hypothetical protein BT96DRAFT_1018774 [Gymnopus androsaceus JB14]
MAQRSPTETLPNQISTPTHLCTQCGHSLKLASSLDRLQRNSDEIMSIVRSGRPPNSDLERSVLAEQLQDTQADIDHCQIELDRLRELLSSRIRSITSPIRMLPCEILVEIFSYLCTARSANHYTTQIHSMNISIPSMVLRQVCISWYNLINGTPALWSTFDIYNGSSNRENTILGILRFFLRKSCSHPLDFIYYHQYAGSSKIIPLINTAAVSDRWRRVEFFGVGSQLARTLFQQNSENDDEVVTPQARCFPELVSLRLQSYEYDISFPLPSCPKVKSLTLQMLHLYRHPSSSCWTTVRMLDLENLTSPNIHHILESCPNAEEVSLRWILKTPESSSQHWPHLVCTRLGKLKLAFDYEKLGAIEPLTVLLDSLTAPALTHLVIYSEDDHLSADEEPFSSVIGSICSMLGRSFINTSIGKNVQIPQGGFNSKSAGVTHLSLDSITPSLLDLHRLLAALPSVTHFDYVEAHRDQWSTADRVVKCLIAPHTRSSSDGSDDDGSFGNNNVLKEESERDYGYRYESKADEGHAEGKHASQGCLLPNLQSLTLKIRPLNDSVIQLIRSRWKPSLPQEIQGGQENELIIHTEPCVCLKNVEIRVQACRFPKFRTSAIQELKRRCQRFSNDIRFEIKQG